MKKASKVFVDPKEKLVSHAALERYNNQQRESTSITSEKRAQPSSDDDDVTLSTMDSDNRQQGTPQSKKKSKTNNDKIFYNKNRKDSQQQEQQHQTTSVCSVENERTGQINISNQALTYAVENNLSPIKIECFPPLENREDAKKFVMNFFKYIEKDFRKEYSNNKQPLGFHHWWSDKGGKVLGGITNDTDLYIYLCQSKHYPTQINNIKIKPDPPKRLPPQNTVIIKFVSNELRKEEIQDELKILFQSIYAIEDMMGTMRSNSRHIRVEFFQKDDYAKIISDGKIGLQGQIFEVEEFLPPPKILICSKCNSPGHTRKVCQSAIDICRRCGKDRNDGSKHNECTLQCCHCGGEHLATDYKCTIIAKFRQELLMKLRHDRNKLPPNIKFFIPVDCRINGDRNRFLVSENDMELRRKSSPAKPPAINPWTARQSTNNENTVNTEIEQSLKFFSNELAEIKKNFENEREKIKSSYENQTKSIQQGWLMIQQQVQAQNQCLTIMSTMIKDSVSTVNQLASTITTLSEIVKSNCPNELDRNKIEISQMMINTTLNHVKNLNDSYAKQEHNMSLIMNKQLAVFEAAMDSLLLTTNG